MSDWKNLFPKDNIFYETENGILYNGDCLEIMSKFPENSVDLVLTDPPYGTTACSWDAIIPFESMWRELKRVRKENTAIVLFGTEPFSSLLRVSNLQEYRYDWIWDKVIGTNYLNAKKMHTKGFEKISVFYKKLPVYNPQMENGKPYFDKRKNKQKERIKKEIYKSIPLQQGRINDGVRFPRGIIKISARTNNPFHPTQKPLALMEYLIKTYSNEGDLVLDFTCGSGTTLVACERLNRKWIGIEINQEYCKISKFRIEKELKNKKNKLKNKLFE